MDNAVFSEINSVTAPLKNKNKHLATVCLFAWVFGANFFVKCTREVKIQCRSSVAVDKSLQLLHDGVALTCGQDMGYLIFYIKP